jgi:hypothetical protein
MLISRGFNQAAQFFANFSKAILKVPRNILAPQSLLQVLDDRLKLQNDVGETSVLPFCRGENFGLVSGIKATEFLRHRVPN